MFLLKLCAIECLGKHKAYRSAMHIASYVQTARACASAKVVRLCTHLHVPTDVLSRHLERLCLSHSLRPCDRGFARLQHIVSTHHLLSQWQRSWYVQKYERVYTVHSRRRCRRRGHWMLM
jgi:hypothetical protein